MCWWLSVCEFSSVDVLSFITFCFVLGEPFCETVLGEVLGDILLFVICSAISKWRYFSLYLWGLFRRSVMPVLTNSLISPPCICFFFWCTWFSCSLLFNVSGLGVILNVGVFITALLEVARLITASGGLSRCLISSGWVIGLKWWGNWILGDGVGDIVTRYIFKVWPESLTSNFSTSKLSDSCFMLVS